MDRVITIKTHLSRTAQTITKYFTERRAIVSWTWKSTLRTGDGKELSADVKNRSTPRHWVPQSQRKLLMSYLVILKLFKGISYSVGRSGRPTKATSCSGDQKWTNHGMHPWLPPMPEKDVVPSSTVFPQTVCHPSLVVSETSLWSSFTTPVFVISVERIQTRSREHRVEDNIYYIEK